MSGRNTNYHLKETWEQIYKSSTCQKREWIDNVNSAFQKIKQYLPQQKQIQILQLGCGSSSLCQFIYKGGYQKITCLDISKQLIKNRTSKNKHIKFINADFRQNFKFAEDNYYDVIIDKGSIDCIFCDEDYIRKGMKCINECYKKLKKGGVLISISLGIAKNRKFMYRNKLNPFDIQVIECKNKQRQNMRKNVANYNKDKMQNSQDYYIYVCRKEGREDQLDANKEQGNMNGIQWEEGQHEDNYQQKMEQQEQKNEEEQQDKQGDKEGQQSEKGEQEKEENGEYEVDEG